ncbi:ABC transporter permease [Cytophagales bacterium WSM2-2]|nr:ABC transporter permease [Cytophagales bacterium WSM2-2]
MKKLAIKDLKLFFADKRSLILTFAVPIALITLFAFAFGGVGQEKGKARPTKVLVADEDETGASKNVIAQLDSLKEIEVSLTDIGTAENRIRKGEEPAVLVFHKGFSDSLNAGKNPPIEFKYDGAKEAEIGILQGALTGKLMSILGARSIEKDVLTMVDSDNPGIDEVTRKKIHSQISKNFSSDQTKKISTTLIKKTPLVAEEETSPGLIQAVSGTAIMMLLFSVVGVGASMLDEKQEGTLKKLLYSPLHPNSILFGKMIYANSVSMLQLSVMFLYAWLVFGLDIFSHLPSLLIMIVATAYACSSFGVLLASIAKSRQQVQGMSTLIVLVMSCIGGSMVPTFIMPLFMQKISVFSVNYWGIQGFYDIFWRKLPITDLTFLSRILVLTIIGTVMNLIALQMFKKNVLKIA